MIVYPKWFLTSKMVLFNLATAIFAILPLVSDFLTDLAGLPDLAPHSKGILLAVAIINIILRVMTTRPVQLAKPPARDPDEADNRGVAARMDDDRDPYFREGL